MKANQKVECFCCGKTVRQAKYLIQHNTAHILGYLDVKKDNDDFKLELDSKNENKKGNNLPCGYCLATDGKCKLEAMQNSTKQYISHPKSCHYERYMKQSISTCDKRKMEKKIINMITFAQIDQ